MSCQFCDLYFIAVRQFDTHRLWKFVFTMSTGLTLCFVNDLWRLPPSWQNFDEKFEMCDIKMEQSKWPTWQVRVHEQKRKPRKDRAKKRARGKIQRKKKNARENWKRSKEKDKQIGVLCHLSLRKSARWWRMMPEAGNWRTTMNCNVIGAYPRVYCYFLGIWIMLDLVGLHFSPYSLNIMYLS